MKSVPSLLPYAFPSTLIRNLSSWNFGVDSVIPSEASSRMWKLPCPNLPSTKAALLTHCPSPKHTSSHPPSLSPRSLFWIIWSSLFHSVQALRLYITPYLMCFFFFYHHNNTFFHTLDHAPTLPVFVLNSGNDVSGECVTRLPLQIGGYWTKMENSFPWHSQSIIFCTWQNLTKH